MGFGFFKELASRMKYILYLFCLFIIYHKASAQNNLPVGSWRDHLSYNSLVDVCEGENNLIYAASNAAIIVYDKQEGSIERLSKTNLLNDVRISALEYDFINHQLIVGYENGNVDFIINEKTARNLPDIRISSLIGDKRIYNIHPAGDRIYLSTGFGIVVVDPVRYEVRETYIIGPNATQAPVYDVAIKDNFIYAALNDGIIRASLSEAVLADYNNWDYMPLPPTTGINVDDLEFYNDRLFCIVNNSVADILYTYNFESAEWIVALTFNGLFFQKLSTTNQGLNIAGSYAYFIMNENFQLTLNLATHLGKQVAPTCFITDSNGDYWITDQNLGLLKRAGNGNESVVLPNGPVFSEGFRMQAFNDKLYLAHGGVSGFWGNNFLTRPISYLDNSSWSVIPAPTGINSSVNVFDILFMAIDPTDTKHVYASSWEEGLIEIYDNEVVNIFNNTNSTLRIGPLSFIDDWVGVSGIAFDTDGNLWMNNALSPLAIHSRTKEGQFTGYNFSPTITTDDRITEIEVGQSGYVWSIVRGRGLLGFNPNGTLTTTSDDNFKLLTATEGNGNLANNDVLSIKEDLDGELWIGTLQGLSVLYNQDAVFNSDTFDAEPILIEQGGNIQELLGTESITAIEIDGGNRKWIGTQTSGVFLVSADGQQQIHHFTTANSPILSNNILDITINQRTGEVFFLTELGIISYFGSATNFDNEMSNVTAYPNPVREDYTGDIIIDGLAYETTVKITDLQGNIVNEIESEGGRAVWNGRNFNGERPASGIYLIFCATNEGDAENVAKIAFIK